MPTTMARVVRRCLHALSAHTPDADLLRRYARDRDADAFAELVARHGPVVLGVCHRALGHTADAEDAFQATFLALARNARTVRDPARLPGWLHRVALRAARRARTRRRPALPLDAATDLPAPPESHDLSWREGLAVLDEELNALPDRLRAPLVLCYLDGLTRDEAALRLGWSLAMLKRRLEEGRTRLRERLVRRGVSAAVLAAAAGTGDGLRAALAPGLLSATARLPFDPAPESVRGLAAHLGGSAVPAIGRKAVFGTMLALGGLVVIFLAPWGNPAPPAAADLPPPGDAQPGPAPGPQPVALTEPAARIGSLRFRLPSASDGSVLSADGKTLIAAADHGVFVSDAETGERKHEFRDCGVFIGFGSGYMKMALSPDGTLLAQVSFSEVQLRIWDLTTGRQVATFGDFPVWQPGPSGIALMQMPAKPPEEAFTHFAFTADGTQLVLCGRKGARFVEARTGKEVRWTPWTTDPTFPFFTDPVAVTRDGRLCLTSGGPEGARTLTLRETATGKAGPEFALPKGHAGYGEGTALSPDGKRAVCISDATIHVWDLPAGTPAATLPFTHPDGSPMGSYSSSAFSADSRLLYVGTRSGEIRRYDLTTKSELPRLSGHRDQVTGVHPTADGKRLVSAGWDGRVRRFDLETGAELPAPDGYDYRVALAGSPDGSRFAVGDWYGRLDVFEGAGRPVRTLQAAGLHLLHLAFTPDGRKLAAYDLGGKVRFWNTADWSEQTPVDLGLAADDRYARRLAFSRDGTRLLTGTFHIGVCCWDLAARAELWRHPTTDQFVAAFSQDGRHILFAGSDKSITWRNPRTGETRQAVPLPASGDRVFTNTTRIAFAPDGRSFLTAHQDAVIRHWDAETGKLLGTLNGHTKAVGWTEFSPDGKWVASGSLDRTVRVWEAATGTEVCRLTGHDSVVRDGAWGPRGRSLVAAAGSEVLLWSLRPKGSEPSPAGASLWDDLAADPVTAYRAQWALLEDPNAAVKLLRERQTPETVGGDDKQIRQLIADLDSDQYRTRERAVKALRDAGGPTLPHLRTAQAKASPEAARRLSQLLAQLTAEPPTPNDLRQMRAVQVLELARTPEAKAVLTDWAAAQPGVLLTVQAADALQRLNGRAR
jgi:RNA polymerase sigma factor (sigma-70 family)